MSAQEKKSSSQNGKLSKKTHYGFALAISAYSMFFAMNQSYWSYYMTDVALLSATVAGILLIVCRIATACFDVLAGYVLERFIPPWGKYRSFLIFVPTLACFFLTLMFTHPSGASTTAVAAYMASVTVIAVFFQDLLMSATMAVVPQIAPQREDRNILSAKRGQGSSFGKIVFGFVATPVILFFNGGVANLGQGYVCTALLFGIYMICSYAFFYRSLPGSVSLKTISKAERAQIKQKNKAEMKAQAIEKISFFTMLKLLVKAKAVCGTVLADAMRYCTQTTLLGLLAYYMVQVYDNIALVAIVVSAANFFAFFVSVAMEKTSKHFDSRSLYIAGMVIALVSLATAFLLGRVAVWIFVACVCGVYCGVGIMASLSVSLLSDGCLYSEYESGVELKGFMMAISILSPSIGMIGSSVGITVCLSSIHYVGGQMLSAAGQLGLHCFITLLPFAFMAIGLVAFLLLNHLDKEKMAEVEKFLAQSTSASE